MKKYRNYDEWRMDYNRVFVNFVYVMGLLFGILIGVKFG